MSPPSEKVEGHVPHAPTYLIAPMRVITVYLYCSLTRFVYTRVRFVQALFDFTS